MADSVCWVPNLVSQLRKIDIFRGGGLERCEASKGLLAAGSVVCVLSFPVSRAKGHWNHRGSGH